MPFKSKAQRRFFYAKESRGELPKGTASRWEKETEDKDLPERLHKKAGTFWEAFFKRAAEEVVVVPEAAAQEPVAAEALAPAKPQRMMKWNALGGVDGRTPEELQKAQASDLITLPEDVPGANCGNCEYFQPTSPERGGGFCSQPEVNQNVSERMCCVHWDAAGVHRAWETGDVALVAPAQVGPDGMPVEAPVAAAPAGELPLPGGEMPAAAPAEPAAAEEPVAEPEAEKPKEKASAKKKESVKAGPSTININVGHSKKASLWDLLQ